MGPDAKRYSTEQPGDHRASLYHNAEVSGAKALRIKTNENGYV
jgi:hypothetical protein